MAGACPLTLAEGTKWPWLDESLFSSFKELSLEESPATPEELSTATLPRSTLTLNDSCHQAVQGSSGLHAATYGNACHVGPSQVGEPC